MILDTILYGPLFSAVMTALVALLAALFRRGEIKQTPVIRRCAVLAFLFCVFLIFFATVAYTGLRLLFAAEPMPAARLIYLSPLIRLFDSAWLRVDAALNVLLFIPFGALLPVALKSMRRLWKTALCALLFSVCIETVQYFIGRTADIDDVMMNVLGGTLGCALFFRLNRLLREKAWWKQLTGTGI